MTLLLDGVVADEKAALVLVTEMPYCMLFVITLPATWPPLAMSSHTPVAAPAIVLPATVAGPPLM